MMNSELESIFLESKDFQFYHEISKWFYKNVMGFPFLLFYNDKPSLKKQQ